MKNRSLRFKIALLVGIVLIIACLTLTVNSLYSARGYYGVLENETIVEALPDTVDTEKIVEGEIVLTDTPSPYSVATQQFSIQGIVVMIVAILLSLIAAYCLTGRLLVPLTILTDSIKKVNQERLNQRVELPNTTGEVKELAEAFNSMMDRLENSFQIQKNFAANAAHELKTPLAVLKTGLQVLEMEETPQLEDYREFTYAAKNSIDRLTGTVDALMTLAVSSDSSYTETVEILPLLKLVVNELKSKADEAEITVSVFGDCPKICAEQTLVYRAIFLSLIHI